MAFLLFNTSMVPTTTRMTTTTTAMICVSGAIGADWVVVPEDGLPSEEDVGVESDGGSEGGVPD